MKKKYINSLFLLVSLFFSIASFAQRGAANYSGTIINNTGRTMVIQDILATDTLNGLPVSLSQVNITQVTSTNNFVSVNATGSVVLRGSALSGTYNAEYQICQ
ncbi:MAG: hypothetical protein H7199_02730, partial [Burkholderiales bacterium]|nr:hypothetical protein [Flavobacterium sp.]